MKKILSILAALIVGIIAFGAYMFYTINKETSLMKSLPTGEILPGIYAVQDDFSNMYLVENDGKYIAFDAGGDKEVIQTELAKLQIKPEDVQAVFLTHTDYDHVAGVDLFTHAKVYISKAEEQMIDGSTSRMLIFKNKLEVPYTTLADGQEVLVNGKLVKGILTEGHTPGSTCFQIDNLLFAGDLASLQHGKMAPFNAFFDMDTETSIASQEKIKGLDGVDYLFTAHYGFGSY